MEKNIMKKQLKNITIVSYNCINPIQSVKALLYSSKDIDFAEMILVSNVKPDNLPKNIKFIETMGKTHNDSSIFAYQQLPDLIQTDFYLGIHDDGFIINPHLWDDNFFNYDYIGAPWKNYGQRNRVGNGGFCLRSKKFLDLCKNIKYLGGHEDGELTNQYYDYFTYYGCRYAPVEVAMKFSLESKIPECEYNLDNCFGFHGRGDPKNTCDHDGFYHQFQEKCRLLEMVKV
jgi:hypothetical protein